MAAEAMGDDDVQDFDGGDELDGAAGFGFGFEEAAPSAAQLAEVRLDRSLSPETEHGPVMAGWLARPKPHSLSLSVIDMGLAIWGWLIDMGLAGRAS
jgi:hypothetical protein